jgi:hypothetical protein
MSNYTESFIPVERDGVMQLQLVKTEKCDRHPFDLMMAKAAVRCIAEEIVDAEKATEETVSRFLGAVKLYDALSAKR